MSEYMMDLRKLVGSRPIFQNGASVLIINDKEEVLLGLRSDNKCWGYPGGSIELGEALEEAARRELFEEFSITADTLQLFNVFSGEGMYYKYPNGDEVHNIDTVFICRSFTGTPKADGHEIIDIRYFPINALPENLSPPNKPIFEAYKHIAK